MNIYEKVESYINGYIDELSKLSNTEAISKEIEFLRDDLQDFRVTRAPMTDLINHYEDFVNRDTFTMLNMSGVKAYIPVDVHASCVVLAFAKLVQLEQRIEDTRKLQNLAKNICLSNKTDYTAKFLLAETESVEELESRLASFPRPNAADDVKYFSAIEVA